MAGVDELLKTGGSESRRDMPALWASGHFHFSRCYKHAGPTGLPPHQTFVSTFGSCCGVAGTGCSAAFCFSIGFFEQGLFWRGNAILK